VKIRRLRKLRGWTQAQLAERCGLAQQHVAKLESEDADPQVSTLRKIASALGVELGELFWTRAEFETITNAVAKRHRLNVRRLIEQRDFIQLVMLCSREQYVDPFHPFWERVEIKSNRITVKGGSND
jgi:transcriptional regulator with XRE-family HTH domain